MTHHVVQSTEFCTHLQTYSILCAVKSTVFLSHESTGIWSDCSVTSVFLWRKVKSIFVEFWKIYGECKYIETVASRLFLCHEPFSSVVPSVVMVWHCVSNFVFDLISSDVLFSLGLFLCVSCFVLWISSLAAFMVNCGPFLPSISAHFLYFFTFVNCKYDCLRQVIIYSCQHNFKTKYWSI